MRLNAITTNKQDNKIEEKIFKCPNVAEEESLMWVLELLQVDWCFI
jgi:hypothetical protein